MNPQDGIVYVGGTFDLFHIGHVELLKKCRQTFKKVIVSLNTDEFAQRYKRKPVYPLKDRIEILRSCKYVDEVIVNIGCEDSTQAIDLVQPDYICHGDDWTGDNLMKQMGINEKYMDEVGVEFYYLPYTQGVSSSQIRLKL